MTVFDKSDSVSGNRPSSKVIRTDLNSLLPICHSTIAVSLPNYSLCIDCIADIWTCDSSFLLIPCPLSEYYLEEEILLIIFGRTPVHKPGIR